MTLKPIYKLMALMLPLMGMASCSDTDIFDEGGSESVAELRLTLSIPEYSVSSLGTRATEAPFSSIHVICYQGSQRVKDSLITSGWLADGDNYTIDVKLHPHTTSLQFVTNATVPASVSNLSTHFTTDPDQQILWGEAQLKDLISSAPAQRVITLCRQFAGVSVHNLIPASDPNKFEILEFGVFGTASFGSIAPADANSLTPNINSQEDYSFNLIDKKPDGNALKPASGQAYIFETDNKNARIIVHARFNGIDGYYPIAFRKQLSDGNSEIPGECTYRDIAVLRNHLYKVEFSEVRSPGYKTLQEAYAAQPDNRATVMITDTNAGINSITSNADYILGVADEINGVACTASQIQVDVFTNRPQGGISLSSPQGWIKASSAIIGNPTASTVTSSTNTSGYRYAVKVNIDANTSQSPRTGTITVQAGDLIRTVSVTQLGVDYKRDANRKVSMIMDGSTITSDYFKWIDEELKGATADAFCQNNVVRNDGLHFPAAPAYTMTYRIPRLSGDTNPNVSGSIFTLSTSNSAYYEISMQTQSAPGQTIGSFSVTNSAGITISYPLYRTGWIHLLKDSHKSLQRPGGELSGWYYYELVKAGNYWMLDRNLGATCNYPYITTNAEFAGYSGACGGYFKVSTTKSGSADSPSTITSALGVSQFNIPKRATFEALSIQTSDLTPQGSERTYVPYFSCTSILGQSSIFIPNAGYYEDDILRTETYATLWTRTLVSGNQGFSKDSPDFGYWYQYLNINGRKVGFSNMRLADGTLGEAPTEESVFKYLPIRLVWGAN